MAGRGEPVRRIYDGFVPGRHAIDAYGAGGFRFAEMSHRGSILALPSGVHVWIDVDPAALRPEDFDKVVAERGQIEVLLIGLGREPARLPDRVAWRLREAGIRFDVMTTGAAARTYSIMLGENRKVAAALIPVD